MSLSAPTRRLAGFRCRGTFCSSLPIRTTFQHQHQQWRTAASGGGRSSKGTSDQKAGGEEGNAFLDNFVKRNPEVTGSPAPALQQMPAQGDLGSSSIFENEAQTGFLQSSRSFRPDEEEEERDIEIEIGGIARSAKAIERVIHPHPRARERWYRKKVIQMVRKGARLSKEEFVKRTEREHLAKSHNMKTSVKKLGMIARQIAGKTIDNAITQMRFSKKKVAQEVLKQLEFARDEAVVMRGMGLGNAAQTGTKETPNASSSYTIISTEKKEVKPVKRAQQEEQPTEIQLKDGKRHKITNRTNIYIDQAWVGRGPYGQLPDFRARGRVNTLRTPFTSLSVVLKEEKTRIRQHQEREAKRKRKITDKVWVHLPDRPIQTHRQWYSW